jgi:hypothetical protein
MAKASAAKQAVLIFMVSSPLGLGQSNSFRAMGIVIEKDDLDTANVDLRLHNTVM